MAAVAGLGPEASLLRAGSLLARAVAGSETLSYHVTSGLVRPPGRLRRREAMMEAMKSNDPRAPLALLVFLRETKRLSARKVRLYSAACCRRIWRLTTEASRKALVIAERHAENLASDQELVAAHSDAEAALCDVQTETVTGTCQGSAAYFAAEAVCWACYSEQAGNPNAAAERACTSMAFSAFAHDASSHETLMPANRGVWDDVFEGEATAQGRLLLDIFGPLPLRQLQLEPSLLTAQNGLVVKLAQAAYENRSLPEGLLDPVRLAIVADAVEEFGGDELAAHLRSPGPHVAGCWVIDLLTGKS